MYVAGIDCGSTTTKVVILNNREQCGSAVLNTGGNISKAVHTALGQALAQAGIVGKDLQAVVATGYGRETVSFADRQITEISCHARGVNWIFPRAQVVIDIGGQDSKIIRLGEGGRVADFCMNEKCAAGTGRFLDVMSRVMQMEIGEFSRAGLEVKERAKISSICTVFAESEVISCIAGGILVESIIAGIHDAVANRVYSLARKLLNAATEIVFTGGVANNPTMVRALEQKIGTPLRLPPKPQSVGALGAAVFALDLLPPATGTNNFEGSESASE